MRIWWCQEHKGSGTENRCDWAQSRSFRDTRCRMVPMRLIPDNDETVEIVDRESVVAALEDADYRLEQGNSISPPYADRTLFALAAVARVWLDGETS